MIGFEGNCLDRTSANSGDEDGAPPTEPALCWPSSAVHSLCVCRVLRGPAGSVFSLALQTRKLEVYVKYLAQGFWAELGVSAEVFLTAGRLFLFSVRGWRGRESAAPLFIPPVSPLSVCAPVCVSRGQVLNILIIICLSLFSCKGFIYLFLEKGKGESEGEKHPCVRNTSVG